MDPSGAPLFFASDPSGSPMIFTLGAPDLANPRRIRIRPSRRSAMSDTDSKQDDDITMGHFQFEPVDWHGRWSRPPAPGYIRILYPPPAGTHVFMTSWWLRDRTLTGWNDDMRHIEEDISGNPIAAAIAPPDYIKSVHTLFAENQRRRWLARWTLMRWRNRVWRRRTQCNVDMIDMEPVADRDAIFLTDTKHRQIYRFHRRDVYQNLLSNLMLADDYFPTPRAPTNPWTNMSLTLSQTIAICQQLLADFARRGVCPPVIFAGFCAAGYDVKRFRNEQTSLLSQLAIQNYFKEINEYTRETVFETMIQIFTDMGLQTSPVAVRRWLRMVPVTAQHRAWFAFARDYTLYLNLHIQARAGWLDETAIHRDAARLLATTDLPNPTSVRVQQLRTAAAHPDRELAEAAGVLGLRLLPLSAPGGTALAQLLQQPTTTAGGTMQLDLAMQLIQTALFRL